MVDKKPEQVSEGRRAVQKFLGVMTPGELVQKDGAEENDFGAEDAAKEESRASVEKELLNQLRSIDASPEMTYAERVERLNISMDEAAKIVDDVISKGFYERSYPISKKHSVTFRTRGVTDQERLQEAMETTVPRYALTVNEMTARYNVAASLSEFRGKKFSPKDFKEANAFVGKLPLPVFNALVERLSKFDELMYTVLSDGAVENF